MKPPADPPGSSGASGLSRRRDMRLDAPRGLRIAIASAKGRFVARDLSMGGMAIVATAPLGLRTVHTLTLTFGSTTVHHRARVQHCRRNPDGGWLVGTVFVEKPLHGGSTIGELFNAVLSAAISFS